jgi:polyisoprenoid-binding protein YceI
MTSTHAQTSQATSLPTAGTYTVDPMHSTFGFVARHLMASKVRGNFKEVAGTIVVGETPESSSVQASAKASSITTSQDQRDEHLRSSDFLEVETYPELSFVSKRISDRGDGHYDLVGDLTIKGTTKEVTFDLEFLGAGPGMAPDSTVAAFEATTSIDRGEFGVDFNGVIENGSFIIGKKIDLEIQVEASKNA